MTRRSEENSTRSALAEVSKNTLGYQKEQVDDFFNDAHTWYEHDDDQLTQQLIQNTSFDLVKGGYAIDQVDAALTRLERAVVDKTTALYIQSHGRVAFRAETEDLFHKIAVIAQRPPKQRFGAGESAKPSYDRKQVDELIDHIIAKAKITLGFEKADSDVVTQLLDINTQLVSNVIFTQRKGSRGYDERQVDYYLSACIQLLSRIESYLRYTENDDEEKGSSPAMQASAHAYYENPRLSALGSLSRKNGGENKAEDKENYASQGNPAIKPLIPVEGSHSDDGADLQRNSHNSYDRNSYDRGAYDTSYKDSFADEHSQGAQGIQDLQGVQGFSSFAPASSAATSAPSRSAVTPEDDFVALQEAEQAIFHTSRKQLDQSESMPFADRSSFAHQRASSQNSQSPADKNDGNYADNYRSFAEETMQFDPLAEFNDDRLKSNNNDTEATIAEPLPLFSGEKPADALHARSNTTNTQLRRNDERQEFGRYDHDEVNPASTFSEKNIAHHQSDGQRQLDSHQQLEGTDMLNSSLAALAQMAHQSHNVTVHHTDSFEAHMPDLTTPQVSNFVSPLSNAEGKSEQNPEEKPVETYTGEQTEIISFKEGN